MEVRKSTKKDIPQILSIIDDAKTLLKSMEIDQWQNGYPNQEQIENDIDNDEWEKVFNINVKGVALTIKHSVELMKSSGGSIIVMGSINSLLGHSGQSLYTASKHALVGIVKCAAIELGKYNIRINAIGPGPIATEALLKRLKSREDNKGMSVRSALDGFANNTALGRMPTEDDVANTALYLSSNLSSSITGQIIPVCSGLIRLE